jgi:hypothetical protein
MILSLQTPSLFESKRWVVIYTEYVALSDSWRTSAFDPELEELVLEWLNDGYLLLLLSNPGDPLLHWLSSFGDTLSREHLQLIESKLNKDNEGSFLGCSWAN